MADDKQPDVGAIKAQALKDERARIQAILGCEEAKGREGLARHLALETDMDPEVARKALAAAPAAAAAPVESSDQLGERMKALGNPKVGIESDKGDDTENEINAIAGFLPAAQRRRVS